MRRGLHQVQQGPSDVVACANLGEVVVHLLRPPGGFGRVEPGLPATFYLPRPCVADVLRLQGILCLRTRGAVGLRARVPAEVSGRDAAGGSAWSTAPTGPPGLPCEQRGAVGLRARAPADVSSRDAAAVAEPTHQLVAWLTVRTTRASSRRSNEPRCVHSYVRAFEVDQVMLRGLRQVQHGPSDVVASANLDGLVDLLLRPLEDLGVVGQLGLQWRTTCRHSAPMTEER
ncbi:hypothetical protein MRX96_046573 [Rhipicephalus microplus]